MKRRFWLRWATVAVLAAGVPVAAASFGLSRTIVENDEQRLLEREALVTSFAFDSLIASVESALDSAGVVAQVTGDDPEAFARLAQTPGLRFFTGLGVLRQNEAGVWNLAARAGEPRADLEDLPPGMARGFDRQEPGTAAVVSLEGSGLTRLLTVSAKSGEPDPLVVYGEMPMPEGTAASAPDGDDAFGQVDYAVYWGREASDRVVFASTDDLPIDGDRATVVLGSENPEVHTDSKAGEAVAGEDELLMVTTARGHLVGDLAANFPWFLLAATTGLFLSVAGVIEVVLRRRDHALSLVEDLEGKNTELDAALQERAEAEAALRTSEERFRTLVAGSPDMLMAFDVDTGEISVLNRDDFLGHPVSVLRSGGPLSDFVHPDDIATVEALTETIVTHASSEIVEAEYRIRTAGGEWEWVRTRAKVLDRKPDGTPARLLGALTVITAERKAAEEREHLAEQLRQAQRLEAVGQLAGGIAHDFNNLLAVILSYAGFALDELEGHPARDDVEEISQAARRAADLTSQLLTFSRRQVVEPALLDVGAIVDGAERILERALGETIHLSVTRDLPLPAVEADAGELEQVLMNLAVNARDAMSPDGGRLGILIDAVTLETPEAELVPGRYVRLSVSDTGCGMEPEIASRAFEPFFTTKGAGEGTGMGLATVYGIAKRWGGGVSLYSEPGFGTTVRVYFPAAGNPAARPVENGEPAETHRAGQHETVFLVEDEEAVRRAAKRILEAGGYRVVEAASGAEALTVGEIEDVDLLLTDVIMPGGVSGRDLAETLRARHPDLAVVYMSGYTADVIAHQGVLDPDVTIVEKPFSAHTLLRAVGEVIDARSEARTP